MSEYINLTANTRKNLGSAHSKRLRKQGKVPAVIYGKLNNAPLSIMVEEKEATKFYRTGEFLSTVTQLEIEGKKHLVVAKEVQLDPISELVRHIDFVNLSEKTHRLQVPVEFINHQRSVGVKKGGFFNIIKRKITLDCPATAIPSKISVDVVNMGIKDCILASDIKLPEGCSVVGKDIKIASMIGSKGKSEESAAEEADQAQTEAKESSEKKD